MRNGLRCVIAVGIALLFVTSAVRAGKLDVDELCTRRLDRMLAAQTSRLVKELTQCSKIRKAPEDFVSRCSPWIGDDQNLHADGEKMAAGLTRVERHGDDKFPRKCSGVTPSLLEPACVDITDTAKQLRRCVYNQHALPFLLDLIEITRDLPSQCRDQSLNQARIAWRDSVQDDKHPTTRRRSKAIARKCGNSTEHWATIHDAILARSAALRQIVP